MNVRSPVFTPSLVTLAVGAILVALSLVTWRQARALEALAGLDGVRQERALAEAERGRLLRDIQHLESRARIMADAGERLGMRLPDGSEIILLSGLAP